MIDLFPDLPEAIENTQEITDKVEEYELDSDPLMPVFPIPPNSVRKKNTGKNFPRKTSSTNSPATRKEMSY